MGNCCGADKRGQRLEAEFNQLSRNRTQRESAWSSTGTVALRDSKLKALPHAVLSVGAAARVLDASNNQITHLPEGISQLTSLQRLVLGFNQLTTLPVPLCQLSNLKVLVLDSNRLSSLPADIGLLQRLERLSVSNNTLTSLPTSTKQLQRLRVLDVSSNRLSGLPDTLGDCQSMEELNADSNMIQAIPDSFQQLQKLKILHLDSNHLQAVPPAVLTGCLSLHTLLLHDNPITAKMFEETPGFQEFEMRRHTKFDKKLAGGASMGQGMTEGVDRM